MVVVCVCLCVCVYFLVVFIVVIIVLNYISYLKLLGLGVVAQSFHSVRLFATPWTAARQASLSFTISWNLLKLLSISLWCHPTISSSVVSFSSCLQSFPASGSFLRSQLFESGGQRVGASASVLVLQFRWNWAISVFYFFSLIFTYVHSNNQRFL